MTKKIYIPLVVYEYPEQENTDLNSNGVAYWYYSVEEANKQFPEAKILEVDAFFLDLNWLADACHQLLRGRMPD